MSADLEKQVSEFVQWYNYHTQTIIDVKKRCEFLEVAIANQHNLIKQIAMDLRTVEGRGPVGRNFEVITPAGEGVLKKVGNG